MTCGNYVEDRLIFAQCSINILSNQHKVTSTGLSFHRAKKILGYDTKMKNEDIPMCLRTRYFLLIGRKSL